MCSCYSDPTHLFVLFFRGYFLSTNGGVGEALNIGASAMGWGFRSHEDTGGPSSPFKRLKGVPPKMVFKGNPFKTDDFGDSFF